MTLSLFRLFAVALVAVGINACAGTPTSQELAQEYFNLGNAYFELGDYEASFDYYSRAVALTDQFPAASYNLARLYEQRGRYRDALRVLDELLETDPENGLYLETRAYVLFKAGRVTDARAAYADLLERVPERTRVRYNLAVLELEIDNPEQAHQVIEPGIETVEEDAEYRWIASEAAFRAGRPERALEHLEVYRALNVDEPEELARLAQRYAEWDYPLPALEILDAIPETVDNDPDLQLLLAEVVLRGTDDFDRGLTALEEAVDGGIDLEGERVQELLAELSREEAELLRERLQALTDPTEETEVEEAELPDAPETPTAEPENGVDDPQSPPEPLE